MLIYAKNNKRKKKFENLWSELWGEDVGIQYRGEEKTSREKMNILKQGVILGSNKLYYLHDLLEQSKTNWTEPEWGFPKGRRNPRESDFDCATRELTEETGIEDCDYFFL